MLVHVRADVRESLREFIAKVTGNVARAYTILCECITIPDGYCIVRSRFAVNGDTEWCADFILPAVPFPDASRLVVVHRKLLAQAVRDGMRHVRLAILLRQREDSCLDWCECRIETENHASFLLAWNTLFAISIGENGQRDAIGANRCLDNPRYVASIIRLIEILELSAGEFRVLFEIKITAVVHALDFLESERATEVEFHVECALGVVRQFCWSVLMKTQP